MIIQTTFDECEYCRGTNIPHKTHYRLCNTCGKKTFHNFLNWKSEQNPQQTSCINCGEL